MNSDLHAPVSTPSASERPSRSRMVTVLSWCLIVGGALVVPVSAFSLLMLMVGGDGTANATLSGALLVIGLPPATVVAGVGLLRRHRWAYFAVLALLASVVLWNAGILQRGPTEERTYVSPSGLRTTVLASEVDTSKHVAIIVVCLVLMANLAKRRVRQEFWTAVTQAEPMRTPRPPAFSAPVVQPRVDSMVATPKQIRYLWLAVSLMVAMALGLGWLVVSGVVKEQTYYPSKSPSRQRIVQRAKEPGLYWFSIGLYAVLGVGAVGLVGWAVREGRRTEVRSTC
jgi:hypothetical protein